MAPDPVARWTSGPRVVVDGWELLPPDRRRGIGRFLEGLLPPLSEQVDLRVLAPPATADPPDGIVPLSVGRWAPAGRVRAAEVEHLLRLPIDLARTPHDVVWTPGTFPRLAGRGPWVHTLHDLAPLALDHPELTWERRRLRATAGRLRRATRVVTPSRFAADEGIAVLGIDAARIEVVPHGVPADCTPDGPHDPVVAAARPAVVGVGHRDPRKGTADLAVLGARLATCRPGARVHVVGDVDLPHGAPVTRLGRVPSVTPVLRAADVVVVASHHEGFGFVALEAMACGTAVVAYDAAATREVVGDGGILVPVGDVDRLVGAVVELLADDGARAGVAARGRARASTFSWSGAADAYAAVLADVAGS